MLKKTQLFSIVLATLLWTQFASANTVVDHNLFVGTTQQAKDKDSVDSQQLSDAVVDRMDRVAEFKFIRETAKKYNVDIYLFGGTASAFAHYVRWDLLRENGDTRFQPERFDYFFDNIYRSNQDLDIVVDGPEEIANKIAAELKQKFSHFVGNKEAWEVRLLRKQTGDKLPLLDNPDFLNQHTDSNSIGLIKVSSNSDQAFYDLRDWDNKQSLYLNDISNATITYLYSKKHETTTRFKDGKNPSILSAIRYLAKATQYELHLEESDLNKVKSIISSSESRSTMYDNYYVKNKVGEFSLKALLNSPDAEYAWNLLDYTGARKLVIDVLSDNTEQESISWWLSKEPLRTKPLGSPRKGTTAKQLGVDIVAHETNSFQAFDNITRSSQGKPNVFISRKGINGEAAAYGNGFYTAVGKKGARGTGITIRFKVNPNAVEGVDFTKSDNFLIFHNKKALELIPEKISINIVEYFRLLISGDLDATDKGLMNKIKTRISKSANPSKSEVNQVYKIVKDHLHKGPIAKDWFALEKSALFPEALDQYKHSTSFLISNILIHKHWLKTKYAEKVIEEAFGNFNPEIDIITKILSQQHWAEHPRAEEYLLRVLHIKKTVSTKTSKLNTYKNYDLESMSTDNKTQVIEYILSKKYWANKPISLRVLKVLINQDDSNVTRAIARLILSQKYWADHPQADLLLEALLQDRGIHKTIVQYVFSQEFWANKPRTIELLKEYIDKNNIGDSIDNYIVTKPYWKKLISNDIELLKSIILSNSSNPNLIKNILSEPKWASHTEGPKLIQLFIATNPGQTKDVITHVLSQEVWTNDKGADILKSVLANSTSLRQNTYSLSTNLFTKSYWIKHPIAIEYAKKISKASASNRDKEAFIEHALSTKEWAEHPKSSKLLKKLMKDEKLHTHIIKHILSKKYWSKNKEVIQFLKNAVKEETHIALILKNAFSHEHWAKLPEAFALIESIVKRNSENKAATTGSSFYTTIIDNVISKKYWMTHPQSLRIISLLIKSASKDHNGSTVKNLVANSIFSQDAWSKKPGSEKVIKQLLKIKGSDSNLALRVLSKKYWITHPEMPKILKKLFQNNNIEYFAAIQIMADRYWLTNENGLPLLRMFMQNKGYHESIVKQILSKKGWATHPNGAELLIDIIERNSASAEAVEDILSKKHWLEHEQIINILQKFVVNGTAIRSLIINVLSKRYFANHPEGHKIVLSIIKSSPEHQQDIIYNILTKKHWAENKHSSKMIEAIIRSKESDRQVKKLLEARHWKNNPKSKKFKKLLEMPILDRIETLDKNTRRTQKPKTKTSCANSLS